MKEFVEQCVLDFPTLSKEDLFELGKRIEQMVRATYELEKPTENVLKAIDGYQLLKDWNNDVLAKTLVMASGVYGPINCHTAAAYLSGATHEPIRIDSIDGSNMTLKELTKSKMTKQKNIKEGSLVCAFLGGIGIHSGYVIRADGPNSLILHKGGFNDPFKVEPLDKVFPNGYSVECYLSK